MILSSELAALRRDDSPQRRVQQRLVAQAQAWRGSGAGAAIEAELPRLVQGAGLDELPALQALFTPGDPAARTLADGVVYWLAAELANQPLGQVPLRHFHDPLLSTLMLVRCHGASLALQAIDGSGLAGRGEPASVSFSPHETWDHVLAGSALAEIVEIARQTSLGVEFARSSAQLAAGQVAHRQGRTCAQIVRQVPGILVTLKLQRQCPGEAITREFALTDGRLLHQAAASPRDSRLELTAALLGRMGRRDAAPLLAAMAEETGSAHLRWQALRECLGLDTAQGFAALTMLAQRENDPLAAPAGALRAQLLESYPELAGALPCPV
ncbi:MAG: hypothetical protein ACK442_01395 [Novosphingobium sp.]|jgi:hypothetical protein